MRTFGFSFHGLPVQITWERSFTKFEVKYPKYVMQFYSGPTDFQQAVDRVKRRVERYAKAA